MAKITCITDICQGDYEVEMTGEWRIFDLRDLSEAEDQ